MPSFLPLARVTAKKESIEICLWPIMALYVLHLFLGSHAEVHAKVRSISGLIGIIIP